MIIISEKEFKVSLLNKLINIKAKSVTGPGRSGAIASVYASHIMEIPFIPYGQSCPEYLRPILIIDTAKKSGRTLRKAQKKYGGNSKTIFIYNEPPRVRFWYEFDNR